MYPTQAKERLEWATLEKLRDVRIQTGESSLSMYNINGDEQVSFAFELTSDVWENFMKVWTRPDFEEVNLAAEINCYAPAE